MSKFDVTVYIKPDKIELVSHLFNKVKEEFQIYEYSNEIFEDVIMFHYKIDALEKVLSIEIKRAIKYRPSKNFPFLPYTNSLYLCAAVRTNHVKLIR